MSKRVDNFALADATGRMAVASDGTPFDPSADVWNFRTRSRVIVLNLDALREMAGSCFVEAARRPLRSIVETRNLNTVCSAFQRFRSLLMVSHQRRDQHVDEIDAEDIAVWISLGNARYLGQLRVLTNAWQILKIPGFEAEAFAFLDRAREPSQDKHEAVRTWDPDAGPYRPAEDAALKSALDSGFNDGRVSLYRYALARTFRGIGMRPAQLAAMKVGDLRRDGGRVEMHIPLVKQRGIPERGAFMPWKPITQGLADILFLHVAENVGALIGTDEYLDLAPLFPPRSLRQLAPSEGLRV